MIKVLEISIQMDLSLFSRYLWQLGLPHRIFEESGQQQLWVDSSEDAERILELFDRYHAGQLTLEVKRNLDHQPGPSIWIRFFHYFRTFPTTVSFVLLSLLAFPLTFGMEHGQVGDWLHVFTFTDFVIQDRHILYAPLDHALHNGEIWRLWTPMLLHFGFLHLVFNMLWLWEIGRRIEYLQGSARVFNLVMLTAVIANCVQYMMTQNVLFGGMSGVVYGLLGYSLAWSRLRPERTFGLPNGIYVFMFGWLALGFAGIIDSLGFGVVANGAHLGGLVGGLGIGLIAAMITKKDQANQE
jgi:GlpG protein